MDNHYATLNVAMDAPDAVVRAAYRVLAARYHPDRREGAGAARMQQVNAAYDVLSDPRRRAEHDAELHRQRCRRAGDGAMPPPAIERPVRPRLDGAGPSDTESFQRRARVARFYAEHAP
ncbi:MAG: J domain-containing protein [Luteimonas sp.]